MKSEDRVEFIIEWIKNYCKLIKFQPVSLVVGVSGGIDSAVTSTLCAKTGLKTIAVSMPIKQNKDQHNLSIDHINWLKKNFDNVITKVINLDETFNTFFNTIKEFNSELAFANSRSRLRMITLYQIAGAKGGIVVGTGNKVEDYGVGFFTKYGDGGVDIAPIADLYKTEVRELGSYLRVSADIIDAKPTDGLWEDGRSDEDQIGATYAELEEAMENGTGKAVDILSRFNRQNRHKMEPIPTFKL